MKFDKGNKHFPPTNLEVTKININNDADNVIPKTAEATFNIRFNNKHTSSSIKRRLNKIFHKISKKNKSKFKIDYRVSGEAFLTQPNKITGMIQNVIKKIIFQGKPYNEDERYHLKRELGDVLWYWVQGCTALGYTPQEVMEENN